ncbi:MAG: hypothetical protein WBQ04_07510, partial [Candidatus Acidiferrales bacterium]
ETPYPKRALHFPSILSQEEVSQLIDAALTPYHRILLLTLYATGVRNAELTHLKVNVRNRVNQALSPPEWWEIQGSSPMVLAA